MNNEKKYYTPTIDDLIIGLEYEAGGNWLKCKVYSKENNYFVNKCNYTTFLSAVENRNSATLIRVKHLDEEDILSLGFKLTDKDKYFSYNIYTSEKVDLYWNHKRNIIELLYKIRREDFERDQLRFAGVIKNKAQLKFILESILC